MWHEPFAVQKPLSPEKKELLVIWDGINLLTMPSKLWNRSGENLIPNYLLPKPQQKLPNSGIL